MASISPAGPAAPARAAAPAACSRPQRPRDLRGGWSIAAALATRWGGPLKRVARSALTTEFRGQLQSYLEDDLEQVSGYVSQAVEEDPERTGEIVASALEELLAAGALQTAVEVYDTWRHETLPLELRMQVSEILATYSNFEAATSQACSLVDDGLVQLDEVSKIFDQILVGMLKAHHSLTAERADRVLAAMFGLGATPTEETLRLVVEAKTQYAAPGFLINVGTAVLKISRRFPDLKVLNGRTLLAISSSHLRCADLDSAYHWYLASQLAEQRLELKDAHSLHYISQLCRALAIGGRVRQLLRVLRQVKEDGGVLPASTSALSISGYTCGRSLLSIWLEPPAEVLRRRSLWSSDPEGVTVTCAEQWDWQQQEESRHEMYQWYPYLAPDTKLERAWLTPLRSTDHSALGLRAALGGSTPAEQAARERLGDVLEMPVDMASALKVDPPGNGARPVVLTVEPRTWRIFHAETVKKAYATSARMVVRSPKDLKELLLAEKGTRELFGGKSRVVGIPPSRIYEWVRKASAALQARWSRMELDRLTLGELEEEFMDLSGWTQEELKAQKMSKQKLQAALNLAIRFLKGQSKVELTDDEYLEKVMTMSEEELQEAFEALRTKPKEEDDILDGSAADELRLAIDLLDLATSLDLRCSPWDARALLAAAHALGDKDLAAEVLRKLPRLEPIEAKLGPAGEQMVDAMVQGGWQEESSAQFLRGERLYALRDPSHPLGAFQTRYLDPLLGKDLDAAAATTALQKPFEKVVRPFRRTKMKESQGLGVDEVVVFVEWTENEKGLATTVDGEPTERRVTTQVTRGNVLEAKFQAPVAAESLLLWEDQRGEVPEGMKLLHQMGLPTPKNPGKRKELLAFVVATLRS